MPTATATRPRANPGGRTVRHITMREGIRRVLSRAGGPMKVHDIAAKVMRMPGVSTKGKTPEATIAAILATDNLKATGDFTRTAPGMYALRSQVPARRGRRA